MAAPTTKDVDDLESSIRSGALIVQYEDRRVRYRDLGEMRGELLLMKRELGLVKKGPRRTVSQHSKGLGPVEEDPT